MSKGIIRIICGVILILMLILSTVITPHSNTASENYDLDLFKVSSIIGYYLPGICGFVLLIFGVRAYESGETAQLILHPNTKKWHGIVKCIFVCLSLLAISAIKIPNIKNILLYSDLPFVISLICFIIYLLFYQGKKPCYLFSTTLIFAGLGIISNTMDYLYSNLYTIFYLAISMIYIALGIIIYKEKYSKLLVKILSGIAFLIVLFCKLRYRLLYLTSEDILCLSIFVYTCIMPISNLNVNDPIDMNMQEDAKI